MHKCTYAKKETKLALHQGGGINSHKKVKLQNYLFRVLKLLSVLYIFVYELNNVQLYF